MSDALLKEISGKLDVLADLFKKGGATAAPKTAPAAGNSGGATDPAAAKKAAEKAAAEKKAKDEAAKAAAAKAGAGKGPASGTKAPGGKYTIDQVRDLIRQVAAKDGLGKQSAKDVLADDGGGVEKVTDLKPENYDNVAEACKVLLSNEGNKEEGASAEDDLM